MSVLPKAWDGHRPGQVRKAHDHKMLQSEVLKANTSWAELYLKIRREIDDATGLGGTYTNLTLSGTLTLSSMTAGSVLFAGTSGVVSQDNSKLFWDDANNRLGIGTATPGTDLEVAGEVKITGGSPGAGKVLTSNAVGLASWAVAAGGDFSDGGEAGGDNRTLGNTDSYDLTLLTNNIERLRIQEGGKIGIGLVSPFAVTTAQELLHLGDISANEPGIRCESFDAGDGSSATYIDMYASSNNAKIVSSRSLHFDYGAPDTMIFSRAGTQAFRVSTNMGLVIGDDLSSTTNNLHIIPTNDNPGDMTIDTTWYNRECKMTFHRPSGAGNAEANWRVGMTTAASGQFGWKESISGGGGAGTDVMTLSIDGDLAVNSTFQASAYNIVSHEGDVQTYEDEVQTLVI